MKLFQLFVFAISLGLGVVLASQLQEETRPEPPVNRAKKPEFKKRDWEGIFFENIFTEGLVGPRPRKSDGLVANSDTAMAESSSVAEVAEGWSELVSGFVLENEVKRWQQELTSQVTTPVKFKTSHTQISEQFSMLAMWFAIISQYDADVRWKEESHSVRKAFMDAASKSRQTDMSAFNSAKQRSEDLAELVRGGKFPEEPEVQKEIDDWSMIVDRNPIMNRLELAVSDELKTATASQKEFEEKLDVVAHEAELIAAMGRVLQLPEMLDADDEDYNAFAQQMLSAAIDMKLATREKSLEKVNEALNKINQSCTNCHGDYR